MSLARFAGAWQQLAGRMIEACGILAGDPLRAAAGRHLQGAARARQRRAVAHEESDRELRDFLRRNRNWRL